MATAPAALDRKPQKVLLPGQSPQGEYIFGLLLKRTYDIVPGKLCTRADVDLKIIPGDKFWEDPMNSSVKFEADFVPWKIATDVVLNGRAYAPRGRAVDMLTAGIEVD